MKLIYSLLIALISVSGLGFGQSVASAQVSITEVSSDNFFGEDWFELTNFGDSIVDLEGFYWDDDGPAGADGAEFGQFRINPGESLIVLQGSNAEDAVADTFRGLYGLDASVQILTEDDFTGPDTFSGLSGNGDEITLFDTDPNADGADATVIDFVDFGAATEGVSFDFTSGDAALSVAGVNGAIAVSIEVSTEDEAGNIIVDTFFDIGSPGVVGSATTSVPEPGSIALLSVLGALAGVKRRRS